jgi:hypothetical protein
VERAKSPVQRCAVYTRKSSEEGLEQDFNSLSAKPVKRSSRARRARVGVWSRPRTMTAASPAAPWSVRHCSAFCPISPKAGST